SFESTGASPARRILDRGDSPRTALPQTPNSQCWEAWSPYRKDIKFGDGRLPVPAVYEGEQITLMRLFPLLAPQQGGVAASSTKFREATEADAAGVVFRCVLNRKTTRASRSAEASRHFS